MSSTVTSHPLADLEIVEASQYYESKVVGLGQAFLTEIEHAISQIHDHPEAAHIILGVCPNNISYSV